MTPQSASLAVTIARCEGGCRFATLASMTTSLVVSATLVARRSTNVSNSARPCGSAASAPEGNEGSRGNRFVPGLAKEAVRDVDLQRVAGGFGHAAGGFLCSGSMGGAAPDCAVT